MPNAKRRLDEVPVDALADFEFQCRLDEAAPDLYAALKALFEVVGKPVTAVARTEDYVLTVPIHALSAALARTSKVIDTIEHGEEVEA